MRIIIVDDEPAQVNGLRRIVEDICKGWEILTARNGSDAYGLLPADIVLTDIRMPKMDGIELLKKINNSLPNTKVILVSAYQDFQYAQTAIKNNAVDYLLKPCKPLEVQSILLKTIERIQEEKERALVMNDYRSMTESIKEVSILSSIQKAFRGTITNSEKEILQKNVKLDLGGYLLLFTYKFKRKCSDQQIIEISQYVQENIKSILSIKNPNPYVIKPDDAEQSLVTFYFYEELQQCAYGIKLFMHEALAKHNIRLSCGVSAYCSNVLEAIVKLYQEANEIQGLSFFKQGLYEFSLYNEVLNINPPDVSAEIGRINKAVIKKDKELLNTCVNQFQQNVLSHGFCHPWKLKHKVFSLVMGNISQLEAELMREEYEGIIENLYQSIFYCDTLDSLFHGMSTLLTRVIDLQKDMERKAEDDLIIQCLSYISANLSKEITLHDLAYIFHFNPNYLSGKIKEKTGEPYSRYVLNLKLTKAKDLLNHTDLQIQEIASLLGYSSQSYFNRVFRQETGYTPKKYRQNQGRRLTF